MTSWSDQKGIENVKQHYGLEKFNDLGASVEVGYFGRIWKNDLVKNGLDEKFNVLKIIEEPKNGVTNKNVSKSSMSLDM